MAKGWKVTIIVVSILLLFIIGAVSIYFFWPWHKKFFNNADKEFDIPGLDTSFCPQGMTEVYGYDKYIISGYMDDGSASRFYLVDGQTKEVEKYVTLNIKGTLYNGHAGGVATYGNSIWTVSSEEGRGVAYRFKISDILNAESGASVDLKDQFNTLNNADFVFVHDKMIWVGEFYKPEKYETDAEHHIKTRSGETNKAMIYGFGIKESASNGGLSSTYPSKAISCRDLVQGVAITSTGNFVVSTSYSIPDSNIFYYEDILNQDAHGTYDVGYQAIPLWYLDDESLINKVAIPSMSEEIVVKNDRVYILFESACKKYKMYNRTRIDSVYSLPVSYFES